MANRGTISTQSDPLFTYIPSNRWYMGEITDTARAWSNGDADRLAAAALARLLTEKGVTFEWDQSDTHMKVGGYFDVIAKGVRDLYFAPAECDDPNQWFFYVNLSIEGTVVLMGASYRRENPLCSTKLVSTEEWLRGVGAGHPHAELSGAVV